MVDKVVVAVATFYRWFWYHTEFWIANKFNRRPYTYIMRDWIYTHKSAGAASMVVWFLLLIILCQFYHTTALILGILTALVTGHLVWGSTWIPEEQETPPYLPVN